MTRPWSTTTLGRRRLVSLAAVGTAGAILAACGAAPAAPTTAPPVAAPTTAPAKPAEATKPAAARPTTAAAAPAAGTPAAATGAGTGGMRALTGKLSLAYKGSVPLRGQEPNAHQKALTEALAQYKTFQPGVEVEVTDVPPQGGDWLRPLYAAKQAPDIIHVNAEPAGITVSDAQKGTLEVINFFQFSDEPNPYSDNQPWKNDWASEADRFSRWNSLGDKLWVNITNEQQIRVIFANLDILKQFGQTGMPATFPEMYDLFKKINDGGKAVAWEGYAATVIPQELFINNLAADTWVAGGGDLKKTDLTTRLQRMNNACKGLWVFSRPEMKEAWTQSKRYLDSYKGGAASYFADDKGPDNWGERWLNGQAAFWVTDTTRAWGKIRAAEESKTLKVGEFGIVGFPALTQDALVDKSQKISFGGYWRNYQGGFNQYLASGGGFRKSGQSDAVDALARDFLQFMTSVHGAKVVLASGSIPQHPRAAGLTDPRVAPAFKLRHPSLVDYDRGHGNWINSGGFPGAEKTTAQLLQGFYTGALTYDEFAKRADDQALREAVTIYNTEGPKGNWDKLDKACVPFGATYTS
jgi:hypothetical protein